ncbi:MAG: substrate-binding domain-containing protein, partial [Lachnospiraceae bacterium]|nr:substrate-binding domain-containing protein [Lachnospiraceae bacterium]
FDDLPICEYLSPPLTTVEVPKQYLGEMAAKRVIERIENKNSLPLKIETAVRLKKRKSV